jgi:hypothetical protein
MTPRGVACYRGKNRGRHASPYLVDIERFAVEDPGSGGGRDAMAKYLVTCACGRQLTAETRQAGESLPCECGATVAVPTLRRLRELPEAREEVVAATGPAWGARQATMTVSLLLVVACLVAAAASRMSERPVPVIDPVQYSASVDQLVTNMTPLQGWERWIDTYQPLTTTGFNVYKHPATDAMQTNLDWHEWIQWISLGLAGVFGALAVVLGLTGRAMPTGS